MSTTHRVMALFEQALDLPVDEREAFLLSVCTTQPTIRSEVEALLQADEGCQASGFLAALALVTAPDRRGEQLGPWRLLELLGRGGMGEVWLAERDDGLYRHRVAVKFLRVDVHGQQARFANERRILASLAHANIARLIDAGQDVRGAPYVVMEHVDGVPIDVFCARHELSVRQRIELLLKVVDAVQAAHSRLVVHRDLKPANILVDGSGEPKLLDFGIAKLLDAVEPDLTATGMLPLTPEYASPEQVMGEAIGTASDIYSLAVVGYELVSGQRPFRLASTAPGALVASMTRGRQPPLPSRVARARGVHVDRDLDHVLLKALAQQADQRYASCAQLGDDLRRYLSGHPVHAAAAGTGYRTWKFVVRHRLALATAAMVFAGLTGSTVYASMQATEARRQAQALSLEQERMARVNGFLERLLAAPDPARSGRQVTVAEVLDSAASELDEGLEDQPAVRAAMRMALARSYYGLGLIEAGVAQAEAAIALLASDPLGELADLVSARVVLANMHSKRRNMTAAREQLQQARAEYGERNTELSVQIENLLGTTAHDAFDLHAAQLHYRRCVEILLALDPVPEEGVATLLNNLAVLHYDHAQPERAIEYRQQALERFRRIYADPHPQNLLVLSNLAGDQDLAGRYDEAEVLYREVLEQRLELNGAGHPATIEAQVNLAGALVALGRTIEAESLAREAWHSAHASSAPLEREMAIAGMELGAILLQLDRVAEARAILEQSQALRLQIYPEGHPAILEGNSLVGLALFADGQQAVGRAQVEQALADLEIKVGSGHYLTRRAKARVDLVGRESGP